MIISKYVHAIYHIPAAITLIQAFGIEVLLLAWPASRIRFDHDRHKVRDTHNRQVIFEVTLFGLAGAVVAYLNFLLFFARHHLSPVYIDLGYEQYHVAVSLAILTLVLCQTLHLVFVRADAEKELTMKQVFANRQLNQAWALSAFILLNIIYNPIFQFVFNTKPLSLLDWFWALLAAGIYSGLRTVQRYSREHAHHAVVQLHHEVHGHK